MFNLRNNQYKKDESKDNQNKNLSTQLNQNTNEIKEDEYFDVMQSSQQFSTFNKKKSLQPQQMRSIIKYKSTFMESDESDNEDTNQKPQSKQEPQQQNQQNQLIQPKNQKDQPSKNLAKQIIVSSEDSENENENQKKQNNQQSNSQDPKKQEPQLIKQNETQASKIEQNLDLNTQTIKQENNENVQTSNAHFCQNLNVEELVYESQLIISQQRQQYKNDKQIQGQKAFVTFVSSEDDDEQNDKDELADQVPENINSTGAIQADDEMNSSNRILMSVMQVSLSKSIQKQQKMQQSLKKSGKSIASSIFNSKIVFIKDAPVVIGEDQYYLDNINKIRKIQNYYKLVRPQKKQFQLKKKVNKYRANVIKELIQTEQKYVDDLKIIQDHIQKPLLQLNQEIDDNDIRTIFNIDSICFFNQEFLNELKLKLKDGIIYYFIILNRRIKIKIQPDGKKLMLSQQQKGLTALEEQIVNKEMVKNEFRFKPNSQIMDKIIVLLPGFKFYYEYCKGYNSAQKLLENYQNNNKTFQKFIQSQDVKKQLKGLDIGSYLIKPVQRLPKYVLLFKDLLKHTDKIHPDYVNIDKSLKLFEEINDKNNNEIKLYLDQLKIMELQNLYGKHITIAEPNRTLIFEDTCGIYTTEIKQDIIIYAFNNLILFIQKKLNEHRYRTHILLSHTSYVKDKEDTNYYQFMFEIVNKTETVIIINLNQEAKVQLMKKISQIIEALKLKYTQMELFKKTTSMVRLDDCFQQKIVNHNIQVNIIGMETRNLQSKSYIVYIAEVFIEEYQTKIFVRYSQIVQLQQLVSKQDSKLKVPIFSTNNWFQTVDQKVLEERKILIEKFILLVLSSEKCQNEEAYQKQVLENLGLNQDFYKTPQKRFESKKAEPIDSQELTQKIMQSQFSYGMKPNLLQSMMMDRQATNILKAAKEQVNRNSILNFEDEESVILGPESTKQPYFIEVSLMDGQTVQVGFSKTTLTLFIKNKIATHIGLKQWLDFRIFIVDMKGCQRVVDDNETMSVILDAHTQQPTGFRNTLKKIFGTQQKFQFIFRKYFYLSGKQEEADYMQDEVRQKYIFQELIWETRNEQYEFNKNDYYLICALYTFAIEKKLDILILQKVIPKLFLKNVKEKIWFEETIKSMNQIWPQLQKQKTENLDKSRKLNKKLITTESGLARLMLLNYFKSNPLFGMTLYFVECNKTMIQILQKEFKLKINSNIYLGLNYNGLHFLKPENKAIIFISQHQQISEMRALTTEFCCKISDIKLSFNTQFSYEIKSLLTEYQQLSEFTRKLSSKIIK